MDPSAASFRDDIMDGGAATAAEDDMAERRADVKGSALQGPTYGLP